MDNQTKNIDLSRLESELKKRLNFPYIWGRKQSDMWDKKIKFIYTTRSFLQLQQRIEPLDETLANYALNRWLNFWSAKGVEQIFASDSRVTPNANAYDKWVDFSIDGMAFDHKTSVFPKGFQHDLQYAQQNKKQLIGWFYKEQSGEGRNHFKNRIFVVLYDTQTQNHWQLKTEISLIKTQIETYLKHFSVANLEKIIFQDEIVFSDIIWVVK